MRKGGRGESVKSGKASHGVTMWKEIGKGGQSLKSMFISPL